MDAFKTNVPYVPATLKEPSSAAALGTTYVKISSSGSAPTKLPLIVGVLASSVTEPSFGTVKIGASFIFVTRDVAADVFVSTVPPPSV